jgi:hypothetical protein
MSLGFLDTLFLVPDDLDNNTQYFWRVDAVDTDSLLTQSEVWSFVVGTLSLEENEVILFKNYLSQNFPNPFNPTTTIEFSIQIDSKVELSIYNIKGQRVKTLTDNHFEKGNHSIIWNGDDDSGKVVSSGIYFYKLIIDSKTEAVRKCLLMK